MESRSLFDAVADGGGAFELEGLGGGEHFGFQLGEVLLGDVLHFVGAADGGVGLLMRRGFGFDAGADAFLDRFGRDAVLAVVGLLQRAAAAGFVDRALHRVGDAVGVEDDLGVDVAGGAADGLHQRGLAAQEAFLVGVEDRDQRDFGQVEPFAEQVDADEGVEPPFAQVAQGAPRARRRRARCAATCTARPCR